MPSEDAVVLAIDNTRFCLSMAGCKIFKISLRNMIGLALIMDVVKAGRAILINLSHCKRVEIVGATHRMTTKSFSQRPLIRHTQIHTTQGPLGWNIQKSDLQKTRFIIHHNLTKYKMTNVSPRKADLGDKPADYPVIVWHCANTGCPFVLCD